MSFDCKVKGQIVEEKLKKKEKKKKLGLFTIAIN